MSKPTFRFPISRLAAQRYRITASDLANKPRRELVLQLAAADAAGTAGGPILSAGQLDATMLLAELVALELARLGDADEALSRLQEAVGHDELAAVLEAVEREFSSGSQGEEDASEDVEADPKARLHLLLLVFWLNHNPATAHLRRLFDDRDLARSGPYRRVVELLLGQVAEAPAKTDEPPVGGAEAESASGTEVEPAPRPKKKRKPAAVLGTTLRGTTPQGTTPHGTTLRDHLEAPIRASPRSLAGQLESAALRWGQGVADERTLRALDLLAEEEPRAPVGDWQPAAEQTPAAESVPDLLAHLGLLGTGPGPGPGPPPASPRRSLVPRVRRGSRPLPEEADWKKSLVLQAKHTHVWLEQLSERRAEPIRRLDEIPSEEFERLVEQGVTGLWLIGVWERSVASRAIKSLVGGVGAEASAYSVHDYAVAADLGGDVAMDEMVETARSCGLRIGVDVVPNHVGLDSAWVHQHPEWLLAVERSPFPGYDFETPDLSSHPEVGLFLEKGYYDRSDAAVVFRRLDRRTGEERFVYHGNDGTGLPWNDTAQLDYTNAAVRRAMSDLIVAQAKRFSILRFDAAMTLTRLHYQRLWFPAPGEGGAIPSRSEAGLSRERFEQLMPEEFWLEVTRRIDEEAPDTLLIAEAFWLMEPFFVHELAMHRVYNSTFLHELRRQRPRVLRSWLEQTAVCDPGLLRHSVFYLTTPDEHAAASVFGSGDRYFGAMALLAVLPATPLLGHGQIEGLREKYGMEYLSARAQETPSEEEVARHLGEIVPLLARRADFDDHCEILRWVDDTSGSSDVLAVLRGRGRAAVLVVFNAGEHPVKGRLVGAPRFAALREVLEKDTLEEIDEEGRAHQRRQAVESDESQWLRDRGAHCRRLADWLTADDSPASSTRSGANTEYRLHYRDERTDAAYEVDPSEVQSKGLPVELEAGQTLVLTGFGLRSRRPVTPTLPG